MALTGNYNHPDGYTIAGAYFIAVSAGSARLKSAVSLMVYASAAARAEGRPPLMQIPLGAQELDPDAPEGGQIYSLARARYPDLTDA